MKHIILFYTLILLASCGKKQEDSKSSSYNSSFTQSQDLLAGQSGPIKITRKLSQIQGLNENNILEYENSLNEFIVTAEFNDRAFNGETLICEIPTNNQSQSHIFQKSFEIGGSKLQFPIELNQVDELEVTINCKVVDGLLNTVFLNTSITVYKDIVVDKPTSAKELGLVENKINKVGFIFIKEGGIIFINEKKYVIEAQNVYSHKGAIKTFRPKYSQANSGEPGLDGGEINLIAQDMQGELTFELNGQMGGAYIPSYPEGSRAIKGRSADIRARHGRGSAARKCRDIRLGDSTATNGQNGANGANGYKGGDMGTFVVTSRGLSTIRIYSHNQVGKGSHGQSGQLGGAKGGFLPSVARTNLDGLSEYYAHYCGVQMNYQASPGEDGLNGRDGKKGEDGERKLSLFKNQDFLEVYE